MTRVKRKPDNATFHFSNLNPKGNRTGDCVVRAVAGFTGQSWDETFEALARLGYETKRMINSDENYQDYLSRNGYKIQKQPRRADNTKYTAAEFCKEIAKKGNRYILRPARHLTCVGPDCKIWDSWDCGFKSVGNYWIKEA